jgi:hypothetical protein
MRPAPAPCTKIPLPDIVTPDVHETPEGHAGTFTVSPSAAELMADCTSPVLHDAAEMVFAFASRPKEKVKKNAHNSHFNLVIGTVPYLDALSIFWHFWVNTGRKRGQNPLYRRTVLGQLSCYALLRFGCPSNYYQSNDFCMREGKDRW